MAIGGTRSRRGGRRRSSRYGNFTEINITPLTDVMLVLLIIFMVTAQFINRQDQGMNLNLPSASNVEDLNALGGIRVAISREGQFSVDGQNVAPAQLSAQLKSVAKSPQQLVIIEMDKETTGQYLVSAMDAALSAGMPNTCLATAAAPSAAPAPAAPAPPQPAAPATAP
ncbi:MAG: biopolymer transporter ExbD [Armatimonadetes bacterium]|nr:biopolymer transporter ExbD [Armatimonadota bacterium]